MVQVAGVFAKTADSLGPPFFVSQLTCQHVLQHTVIRLARTQVWNRFHHAHGAYIVQRGKTGLAGNGLHGKQNQFGRCVRGCGFHGQAVIEDLYVAGKPIREFLKQ